MARSSPPAATTARTTRDTPIPTNRPRQPPKRTISGPPQRDRDRPYHGLDDRVAKAEEGQARWAQRLSQLSLSRAFAILAVLFVGVLAVCWLAVALLGGLPGDLESAAKVREERPGWVALAPAHALDWLGRPIPGAALLALLGAWIWRRIGWRHALLVIGASGVTAITWLIKDAVDRGRPSGAGIGDPSFPSGHTAWAIAVFGAVAVLAVRRHRWVPAAACMALAGVMGPSRVFLGVHWVSDVIAGYAIGLAWLIGVLLVGLPWAERTTSQPQSHQQSRQRRH